MLESIRSDIWSPQLAMSADTMLYQQPVTVDEARSVFGDRKGPTMYFTRQKNSSCKYLGYVLVGREARTGKSCKVSSVNTRASLFPLQKLPCGFCPRTASGSHRSALFSLLISLRQRSQLAPAHVYVHPQPCALRCARRGGIIPP